MHLCAASGFIIFGPARRQMWSQKSQLSSALEVGRVSRNKRHSPTLKLMDGVQKGLVKGRAVCKSFSFDYFKFFQAFLVVMRVRSKAAVTRRESNHQFVVIFFLPAILKLVPCFPGNPYVPGSSCINRDAFLYICCPSLQILH